MRGAGPDGHLLRAGPPFLRAYRSCGNEIGLYEYSRNAYKGLSGHCIWIPGSRPHRLLPKIEREIASFVEPPAG